MLGILPLIAAGVRLAAAVRAGWLDWGLPESSRLELVKLTGKAGGAAL